jgi:hypothetical protein
MTNVLNRKTVKISERCATKEEADAYACRFGGVVGAVVDTGDGEYITDKNTIHSAIMFFVIDF